MRSLVKIDDDYLPAPQILRDAGANLEKRRQAAEEYRRVMDNLNEHLKEPRTFNEAVALWLHVEGKKTDRTKLLNYVKLENLHDERLVNSRVFHSAALKLVIPNEAVYADFLAKLKDYVRTSRNDTCIDAFDPPYSEGCTCAHVIEDLRTCLAGFLATQLGVNSVEAIKEAERSVGMPELYKDDANDPRCFDKTYPDLRCWGNSSAAICGRICDHLLPPSYVLGQIMGRDPSEFLDPEYLDIEEMVLFDTYDDLKDDDLRAEVQRGLVNFVLRMRIKKTYAGKLSEGEEMMISNLHNYEATITRLSNEIRSRPTALTRLLTVIGIAAPLTAMFTIKGDAVFYTSVVTMVVEFLAYFFYSVGSDIPSLIPEPFNSCRLKTKAQMVKEYDQPLLSDEAREFIGMILMYERLRIAYALESKGRNDLGKVRLLKECMMIISDMAGEQLAMANDVERSLDAGVPDSTKSLDPALLKALMAFERSI